MIASGMSRLGLLRLAGQLVGLLEAEVAEDDAAGRDGLEDRLEAARGEAVGGVQVAGVEVGERQHDDHQQRDGDLPPRRGAVGGREHAGRRGS